jgi:hypothetical protein
VLSYHATHRKSAPCSTAPRQCLVSKYEWNVREARRAEEEEQAEIQVIMDSIAQEKERVAKEVRRLGGHYGVIERQGSDIFAFVASFHARDSARIRQFGSNLCGSEKPCTVRFWTDRKAGPFTLPLSATHRASQVAEYTRGSAPGTDRVSLAR